MWHSNANHLKCRDMPQSLSKQTKPSLIKWHWSGGGSFSIYSLPGLDFSLSLGRSSVNHLAPNETPLSLCAVIGSVGRWRAAGGDAGVPNLPIDPNLDQSSSGQSVQHLPQLHSAVLIVEVMTYKGLLLTCEGCRKRWGPALAMKCPEGCYKVKSWHSPERDKGHTRGVF